ncbi:MAG: hypothetical protein SF028_10175 [Candidatus Sumerlaeia bacterium]|nr:hypothetical protein [Candidatus Sumerlaeia bacterium]
MNRLLRALAASLFFSAAAGLPAERAAAPRALDAVARSQAYTFAADPAVALDGGRLALAWSGMGADGRWRLLVSRDGGEPFVADETLDGGNRLPVLAFPGGGREASVAWVHRTDRRQALLLREQGADGANTFDIVTATERGQIDSPALIHLDPDSPALAWTESTGSESAVWFARRFDGIWHRQRVSRNEHPCEMMPQLLGGAAPRLWYYAWDDGRLSLISCEVALWGISGPKTHAAFSAPPERMPLLYAGPAGQRPGAVWLDRQGRADALLELKPSADGSAAAPAEALSSRPAARLFDPAVVDEGAVAWLAEDAIGRRIALRTVGGALVEIATPASARQLRIDVSGGRAAAVWINEPADGGDGRVGAALVDLPPAP